MRDTGQLHPQDDTERSHVGSAASSPRPASCPEPGQIEAFDAGWNAHEVGLGRESVDLFTHPTGRAWALMAWDIREKVSRGK